MLVAVVRFLVVLFLVRLGVRMVFASRGRRPPDGSGRDLVRDRVCNTFVPRDRALAGLVGGRTEHFCSAECRDRAERLAGPVSS
jgi:hypothetical protein